MSLFKGIASTVFASMLLVGGISLAEAALSEAATIMPSEVRSVSLAQNRAAQCINGYRITHQVKNNGRLTGGVILKCRG